MIKLEGFRNWLQEEKGIILCQSYTKEYEDYLIENKINKKELIEFVAQLYGVDVLDIMMAREGRKRGNNRITMAKGHLVKYVLSKPDLAFNLSDVYKKLFGYSKDHSTAFYWREYYIPPLEFKFYHELTKFIESHNIQWND